MSLTSQSLQQFLDELASAQPVPGGGSVAALAGALAASLLAMVCGLTIDKKGYESVRAEMQDLLVQMERLRAKFSDLMQADINAYAAVMDAYKLPKPNPTEQAARSDAIQAALMQASEVPLGIAELCAETMRLARPIAEKGNKNAASDAGVGTLMAEAGLRSAVLNVSINLAGIRDVAFVSRHRARSAELTTQADKDKEDILRIVEGRL